MLKQAYRKTAALSVVVALSMGAAGRTTSLLSDVQRLSLPVEASRVAAYESNPAQMFYRDSATISTSSASVDIERMDRPFMEQLGDGHTLFSLRADSYMRLTGNSVVWGSAAFTTGKYNNIKWSDCIDYLRIAPYVLGDEAGGDLSMRRYTFTGGYSRRYGSWNFGIDADYRAEIAYRNRDPRVKTIVSDLSLRVGGSRLVGGYSLGVAAKLNIYNQSCDLDFYSPINQINTYTLTGMGTFYKRFMGNTNKNSGYTSYGYSASVQFLPTGNRGLYAEAGFEGYRMSQQLRSFNNITLGYTDNKKITASAAYSFRFTEDVTFRPRVSGFVFDRKGTENLFGTSAGMSYDKIGDRKPYSHSLTGATVELPLQMYYRKSYMTGTLSVSYDRSAEKYSDPRRKLEASHIVPFCAIDFSSRFSPVWFYTVGVSTYESYASSKKPLLAGLDTTEPLGQCVVSNFDMLRADSWGGSISASVSRLFNGFAATLSATFNYSNYKDLSDNYSTVVSLSVHF